MTSSEPDLSTALIVDHDPRTVEAVRQSLAGIPLKIVHAKSISEATDHVAADQPRLVVSELVLDDGSGFALCRQFRESSALATVPIILISRWSRESDRILAFECGADDFLGKPFFQRELSLRVKAVLRRSEASAAPLETPSPSPLGVLSINEDRREVRLEGAALHLTPHEYSLLATLARHRGRVLSRPDLISEAWTVGERPTERTVDAHIKSLRRKLTGAKGAIETVRGVGYRFSEREVANIEARD